MKKTLSILLMITFTTAILFSQTVYIGNPNSTARDYYIPFTLYYKQSLVQTIYYAEEIGGAGNIESISYNFTRSTSDYPPQPLSVQIWMAITWQDAFADALTPIPYSDFTLVYSGSIPVHIAGNNDIEIALDTPFPYRYGNLVIMTHREHTTGYFSDNNVWKTTYTPRVYRTLSWYEDPDTAIPVPDENGELTPFMNQYLKDYISNITLYLGDIALPQYDLVAANITGELVPTVNQPYEYTVEVINVGEQPVANTAYTVSLMQAGNLTAIATVNGAAINPFDTAIFNLTYTPTIAEQVRLYAVVAFTDDEYSDNNTTYPINVFVQPVGAVYIGNPNSQTRDYYTPFNIYYQQSLAQTIYYESEIGREGSILSIGYNFSRSNTNHPTQPHNVKIWMATTGQSTFQNVSNAIPFSAFTLVFEGAIPVHQAGISDIVIPLDSPFTYEGGNLVVMTQRDFTQAHYAYSNVWQYTFTPGQNRTLALFHESGSAITVPDANGGIPSFAYDIEIDYVANTVFTFDAPHSIGETTIDSPMNTTLKSNYPNPFNPSTTIAFEINHSGRVIIDIYNIKGQRVKEVVSGSFSAGKHSVVWNGDDASGHPVGSGVYFYRMTTGEYSAVRKMLLLK